MTRLKDGSWQQVPTKTHHYEKNSTFSHKNHSIRVVLQTGIPIVRREYHDLYGSSAFL